MDALPSTEFRKTYATLTEPTIVTANGHVIGEWRPINSLTVDVAYGLANDPRIAARVPPVGAPQHDVQFNTRPFTPVPKVRGKS